jgi:hypothetical protein
MITDRDLVVLRVKGLPYDSGPVERAVAERYVNERKDWPVRPETEIVPIKTCPCCGEPAWENGRCTKHQGRTPCEVEGCRRSTGRFAGYYLCGEHWKAYVPPGSPERRVLNRLVRLARKLGYTKTERWPDHLEDRYRRAWVAIARRVRRRSQEGRLDEQEIHAMFGWSKDD